MAVLDEKNNVAVSSPSPATINNPTVTGVVVGSSDNGNTKGFADDTVKQGHVCCSCCCDVRRAVIILNVIVLVLAILNLIFFIAAVGVYASRDEDGDGEADGLDSITSNSPLNDVGVGLVAGFTVVAILFYILGIMGAIKYNAAMVLATSIFYIVSIVFSALSYNILAVIIDILFLYPHIVLYQEIKKGIMAPETYKTREEHSCCCV